jgi:hypothetical protein
MPCTLQPWEIEWEEKRLNKKTFDRELVDTALLGEVACSACRTLVETGKMSKASELVQKWWKLHREKDIAAGRKVPRERKK